MRTQSLLPGLVLSAALAAPAVSSAAERLNLNFTGVVSPGSFVAVDSNVEGEQGTHRTSFDGEPVNIALSLQRHGGGYYVEHFEISWTDEAYDYPFLLGWNGNGFPYSPDEFGEGFVSTVDLNSSGGSISISPTDNYHGDYNSSFDLNLSFVTGQPYDPTLSFPTMAVSGGGDIDAYSADYFGVPGGGPFDYFPPGFNFGYGNYLEGLSRFNFTVTSMSQTAVPEPSAWLLMIAGFAAVGVMTRRHAALARHA